MSGIQVSIGRKAGCRLKPGVSHGVTDELGQKAIEDVHPLYHFNATILHLLGLDYERLSFEHNGIQRRLTNVEGKLIPELPAHPFRNPPDISQDHAALSSRRERGSRRRLPFLWQAAERNAGWMARFTAGRKPAGIAASRKDA